ncbi:hypothetical protein PT7_3149 [Pusillimonas sp. T7-7]|uniref:hypothetical protein n=1 Tax=Pusillimonas sp. (strain T7-7) TaxID=1007105 RepID=UPI0002084B9C|nr:hypothetical protein [Pusillimonas sp. T7-7]AEC21689.1 hypothetical protein PT7_3149 [Pusillimonas sp. T7-7]
MARLPRLYAPQIPQLVQAEFAYPLAAVNEPTPVAQLDQLLEWLQRDVREHRIALHAWLLLNDRITLLATPNDAQSMARLIQSLGRRIAASIRHGRVFTGRYRSALIEPGQWVLPAMVWLESLPVQHQYVDKAERWPWSSAGAHTGLRAGLYTEPVTGLSAPQQTLLTDHHDYWQDGNTPFARQAHYRERLAHGLTSSQRRRIEQALFGQWVLGEADFLARVASHTTRRTTPAPRGRPKKVRVDADQSTIA